jgi:uncharacterized protein YigA (DUF484 family)
MTRNRHDAAPDDPGKQGDNAATGALSDAAVADYLRRHPDFLARHSDLLDVLEAPARERGEGVVDLQQFMLDRLRGELAKLRESRNDLIYTGRANMASQARVHEATLAILASRSFEHLIETVTTDLSIILDLDAVTICVEQGDEGPTPTRIRGVHQLESGAVHAVLGPGRSHAFLADIHGEPALFGAAAGLIRSAALLRLDISSATPPALLTLGSRQPDHFDPSQGSELLQFLARALELTIRQWLELPD